MAMQYAPDALPGGMIGLHSAAGEKLREEASVINDLMIDRFKNQVNRKYCGVASLALLINAMNVGYRIKYMSLADEPKEQEKLLERVQQGEIVCVDEDDIAHIMKLKKDIIIKNNMSEAGLTLAQLSDVTMHLGFGVNTYYTYKVGMELDESSRKVLFENVEKDSTQFMFKSADEFRNFAKDYIGRFVTGLIINYNMRELGYKDLNGHFSPLAAYHEGKDMFLVMDVWPDTPPAWVFTEDLYKAMCSIDTSSHLSRGLLHIHELL